MKQEHSDLRREYDAAFEAMRAAQTQFELRRGEVVAGRERVNRLRMATADAEAAAVEAKDRWDAAFHESDGVLNHELKQLRSTLRDAQDLAEDYRNLLAEAEAQATHVEVPALEAAREVDSHRRRALNLAAEIELCKVVAGCAPQMARALRLMDAANTPDAPNERAHTFSVEPGSTLVAALNHALLAIDPSSIELPEDLRQASIAPLRWSEAYSTIGVLRRKAAAEAAGRAA